ncbi:hypothetical protein V5O48_018218 [Marasmius crinis-equi]|uniref:HORMA domain-containing protein n=1 Tax=Marasmius crinis-equi TaxID=585013 RepID=A0ABR3ELT1_9AGAR
MRELLPQDNFVESHFTTAEDGRSCSSSSSFTTPDGNKRNINGFKIMNMCRGYTDEADRILNYLEFGIFDALQKQYLRSFIFAIYLDNKDPNNIIEAYTFNFRYHTIAGTNTTIPIMSLGDDLNKLSLKDGMNDPLIDSAKKGKIPTLKDVKKSVKTLLKTLISSMVQMDVLPKRRYASFKLFYTDDTPPEYEPPHFKPGNYEKDKWHFMTHDFDEAPDKWSIGRIDSGYHSVEVNVSSIATYLPSSTEHQNSPFAGITNSRPSATPAEEAAHRAEETEKQLEDAEKRIYVWSAEELSDADGDASDDPDYIKSSAAVNNMPIGIRNSEGEIGPIPEDADISRMDVDEAEAELCGSTQIVPTRLQEIFANKVTGSLDIPETQSVQPTQDPSLISGLPPSDIPADADDDDDSILDTPTPMTRGRSILRRQVLSPASSLSSIEEVPETQIVTDCARADDTEMLDMETQPLDFAATQTVDTIESFGDERMVEKEESPARKAVTTKADDDVIECECGISIEDGVVFCESGCKRWYHIWCMGYHSEEDSRLPPAFTCFDCCVHADPSWELIKVDLYPTMMTKFKELAIFRRAIKVAEEENPSTIAEFAKHMGIVLRTMVGFIVEQSTTINDIGLVETRARARNKGKSKQVQRRNVQKPKYVFDRLSVKTQAYQDYFNPDREVESRLLGIPQTKASIKSRKLPMLVPQYVLGAPQDETQTQDSTQLFAIPVAGKRITENDPDARPKKKPKISLAPAVDLAE